MAEGLARRLQRPERIRVFLDAVEKGTIPARELDAGTVVTLALLLTRLYAPLTALSSARVARSRASGVA